MSRSQGTADTGGTKQQTLRALRANAPRLIGPQEIMKNALNYTIKAREKVLGGAGCRWLSVNERWVGWFIKSKRLDMYRRGSP